MSKRWRSDRLMKRAVFILAIIVFAILYYMGVMTKKETLPFSKDFFLVETPAAEQPIDIKEVWPLKGRTSGQKVPTLSSKELDQLYQLKLDGGLRNIPVVSFFLITTADCSINDSIVLYLVYHFQILFCHPLSVVLCYIVFGQI